MPTIVMEIMVCLSLWSGLQVPAEPPKVIHWSMAELEVYTGRRLHGIYYPKNWPNGTFSETIVMATDDDYWLAHEIWHYFQDVYNLDFSEPDAYDASYHYIQNCVPAR